VQTDTNLYEKLSAKENLQIWGSLYGLADRQLNTRIEALLGMFGLAGKREIIVGNFSKGMKQKLAIARALIHDPEILFLDEPTAGLDPETSEEVMQYLQNYIENGKRTIFLCSHRLEEVERLSQAIAIIYQGRILAGGTIAELRERLWKERCYLIRLIEASDGLASALGQEKFVVQVAAHKDEIRVALSNTADIAKVVRRLVTAGADILSVQEEQRSLKDIYFAIVPKESHEPPND
jgi:ABC-2 type transport system ATP-binding protein